MPTSLVSKSLVLVAVLVGGAIGGTGHAAPRVQIHADMLDDVTPSAPGRCEGIAGADRAACNKFVAAVADAGRDATLGVLSKDWHGRRLAAFARLVDTERTFARAIAANETGAMSGSSDAADAEQAQNDAFVATLQRLVAGRLSRGDGSFAETDDALNDAYGRVMKVDDTRELGWGEVDKAGILRTERAWIAYRDAFVAFTATLDVPDAAGTIAWELTRQRTASLDSFLGD